MTINPALNRSGYATMSSLLGILIWLALLVSRFAGNQSLGIIELILLLAVLVLVPIGLDMTATPDETGGNAVIFRLARFLQPVGAVLAAASFLVPVGFVSGMLASMWFGVTLLVALFGFLRVIKRKTLLMEELCIDVALLYLPAGAAWLVATRAGFEPLGFGGVIALLTAVHFHYAGFIAPVVAGMTGRALEAGSEKIGRLYRLAALGIIAGPPLVALGITMSRTTSRTMEVVSAAILAVALTIHAGILLFTVIPSLADRRARLLLGTGAVASVVAMVLALLYALGMYTEWWLITIPEMAMAHGSLNALFSITALIGWSRIRPEEKGKGG